jgi:hypothetical protein
MVFIVSALRYARNSNTRQTFAIFIRDFYCQYYRETLDISTCGYINDRHKHLIGTKNALYNRDSWQTHLR